MEGLEGGEFEELYFQVTEIVLIKQSSSKAGENME